MSEENRMPEDVLERLGGYAERMGIKLGDV